MKFFLDMPNTEIAGALGMTAGNVGVVVHRSVKRLRELMGDANGAGVVGPPSAALTGSERNDPSACLIR